MLDNLSYIANIDKSNMRNILQKFSQQCKRAIEMGREMNILSRIRGKKIDEIVVCGLGGSAIGGDILKTLFSNKKILIKVSRDYHTPSWINKQTLVFVISYSGNTEETISSFKEALIKGCPVISVTSGGEIQKLSEKNDVRLKKLIIDEKVDKMEDDLRESLGKKTRVKLKRSLRQTKINIVLLGDPRETDEKLQAIYGAIVGIKPNLSGGQ